MILTVSWSPARLSAGFTTLLFSNLTTGEKGGVSPSSEWMLELEELEESWPGEEWGYWGPGVVLQTSFRRK